MQERHQNLHRYFQEQGVTTQKYVIPFITNYAPHNHKATRVLEIGCGLGGGLKPFLEAGYHVTGIDLLPHNIDFASSQFADHPNKENLQLICSDIYKVTDLEAQFDIVVIRDVLEHVPQQAYFLSFIKRFLVPQGVVFIAFPPWQNPFGGHQQILKNRFLSHCPWLHLLPKSWYSSILKRHQEGGREELLYLKELGMTLERFYAILRTENWQIIQEKLYFINPNYETKFHLKPRKLWKFFNIPYIRNFYTTTGYFLLQL